MLDCILFLTLYKHRVNAVERNVDACNNLFRIVKLGLWHHIVKVTVYFVSVQCGKQISHLMTVYYIYHFLLVLLANDVFVMLYYI